MGIIVACCSLAIFQPGNARAQAWLNDDFAQRRVLTGTAVEDWGELIYGSAQPGDPLFYEHTLWWTWTAPTNGTVKLFAETVSTFFSRAECAVYTGSELAGLTLVTNLPLLSFSGDGRGTAWFTVAAGTRYQISAGTDWFSSFHFRLTLGPRPANDDFGQRIHLGSGDVRVAAPTGVPSREDFEPGSFDRGTLWWSWTAPVSGPVTVWVDGSARETNVVGGVAFRPELWCDATVSVYAGEELAGLWLVPVVEEIQWSDPQFAQASFQADAGRTYQVQVAVYSDLGECAALRIASTAPPAVELTSPENLQVFDGPVRLEALAFDPENNLVAVDYFVDPIGSVDRRVVRRDSPPFAIRTNLPGGEYWIQARATDGHGARAFSDRLQIRVRTENDDFARRSVLSGARVAVEIPDDLRVATVEADEPLNGVDGSMGSLWWSWTAPTSGVYTASVPDGRGLLSVFLGRTLSTLTSVGTSFRTGGVTFMAAAGEQYALSFRGYEPGVRFEIAPGRPPQIMMVQPVSGARLVVGNRQRIEAAAEDEDGGVRQVDFYGMRWFSGQSEWIGSATQPPYALSVELEFFGHDAWWAVVIDDDGHRTVSETVSTTVGFSPPDNDEFDRRTTLVGASLTVTGSVSGASMDMGQPTIDLPSVWWSWRAPDSGWWTLWVSNENRAGFFLGVYTGESLSNLTQIAVDLFGESGFLNGSQVSFAAVAGTTYAFAAGTPETQGSLELHLQPGRPVLLQLTNIPAGSQFFSGDRVTLVAEVSGSSTSELRSVEFFAGDRRIGSRSAPPYSLGITVTDELIRGGFYALETSLDGLVSRVGPLFLSLRPDNDSISRRKPLAGAPITERFSMANATWEIGEPNQRPFVWWSWSAVTGGVYTVDVVDARGYPIQVAVFDEGRLPALVAVSDGNSAPGSAVFQANAGNAYLVGVADGREFALSISPGRGPSIRLTIPGSNAVYPLGETVVATPVIVHDAPVQAVDYFQYDRWLGRVTDPPFAFEFTPNGPGSYTLVAQVTDAVGLSSRSEPVWLQVANWPPANDAFARRETILGTAASLPRRLSGATLEPGEPPFVPTNGLRAPEGSLWWSWRPVRTGPAVIRVSGPYGAFGWLDVFSGTGLAGLRPVASQVGGGVVELRVALVSGTEYVIRWAPQYAGFSNRLSVWQDFLELEDVARSADGRFAAHYRAGLDRAWRVESSTDLREWEVFTVAPSVDGRLDWIDPGTVGGRQRFYRVEPWP